MANPAFILAASIFGIFLLHAVFSRIGKNAAPLRRLARNHLLFAVLYLALSYFLPGISGGDRWVGLLCFFFFQYPFFFILIGQAYRGFSLNICVSAWLRGGSISEAEVFQSYGDGRGIDYVKASRLQVMLESKVAEEKDGLFELTGLGQALVLCNRFFLGLYRLDYIGKAKAENKI